MAEKKIKLADLIKGSGMEEIPKDWFDVTSPKRAGKKAIDMVYGDKELVLKATVGEGEADRGLIIKHTTKGCQVQYWYTTPDNIVPIGLSADGTSKGKAVKKVTLEHTPDKD
tara:strand:+ start:1779 stop:2114 length:336 start_codon:yes stop_codon:yes gene_type:complete